VVLLLELVPGVEKEKNKEREREREREKERIEKERWEYARGMFSSTMHPACFLIHHDLYES